MIVVVAWVMLVEALVIGFFPSIGRWHSGGAASALTSLNIKGGLLPMWVEAAVFAAYGLGFAAAATFLVLRKDIA